MIAVLMAAALTASGMRRFDRLRAGSARRWLIIALILSATGCDMLPKASPVPTDAQAYVLDATGSTDADRCDELAADLVATLANPAVRRLELVVLAVGGSATGDEPQVIIPRRRFAALEAAFETPGAEEAHRTVWLREVIEACRARLRAPDRSPIYRTVERAVETLAAVCMSIEHDGGVCTRRRVAIFSDLRENVHPAIAARLRRPSRARHRAAPAALPTLPRVELAGIEVTACGVSATRAMKGDRIDPDAVVAVWREILGADVSIAAGCPRLAEDARKEAARGAP